MSNGRILKCFDWKSGSEDFLSLPCVGDYDRWVRARLEEPVRERADRAALEVNALYCGNLRNVDCG